MPGVKGRHGGTSASSQALLLKAVLAPPEDAVRVWKEWRESVDLENDSLDADTLDLLPWVWRRLSDAGVSMKAQGKIRGLSRRTWYKNHLQIRESGRLLEALNRADIPCLLFGSLPLAASFPAFGDCRPIDGANLLVPAVRLPEVWEIIQARGFESRPRLVQSGYEAAGIFGFGRTFIDGRGIAITAGPTILGDLSRPAAENVFWTGSRTAIISGVETPALGITDELFRICLAPLVPPRKSSLLWIADAAFLIAEAGESIDWGPLIGTAAEFRLSRPLSASLTRLSRTWGIRIPPDVIARLDGIPAMRAERRLARRLSGGRGLIPRGLEELGRYRRYRSLTAADPAASRGKGFLKYLKALHGAGTTAEIVRRMISAVFRSLSRRSPKR